MTVTLMSEAPSITPPYLQRVHRQIRVDLTEFNQSLFAGMMYQQNWHKRVQQQVEKSVQDTDLPKIVSSGAASKRQYHSREFTGFALAVPRPTKCIAMANDGLHRGNFILKGCREEGATWNGLRGLADRFGVFTKP